MLRSSVRSDGGFILGHTDADVGSEQVADGDCSVFARATLAREPISPAFPDAAARRLPSIRSGGLTINPRSRGARIEGGLRLDGEKTPVLYVTRRYRTAAID
jgi:hypothetical protein